MLVERSKLGSKVVALRVLSRQPLTKNAELSPCALHRCPRVQSRDYGERISLTICLLAERVWKIKIDTAAGIKDRGEIERFRQNAHHGNGCVVQGECASHNAPVGPISSPVGCIHKRLTLRVGCEKEPKAVRGRSFDPLPKGHPKLTVGGCFRSAGPLVRTAGDSLN